MKELFYEMTRGVQRLLMEGPTYHTWEADAFYLFAAYMLVGLAVMSINSLIMKVITGTPYRWPSVLDGVRVGEDAGWFSGLKFYTFRIFCALVWPLSWLGFIIPGFLYHSNAARETR